mmetsp:Transcript_41799/g.77775  ORF Transcript_41799/g.77775 Transcript_41799/m.77775 type:complete len:236 (+) Transcript_41799:124-831(+)
MMMFNSDATTFKCRMIPAADAESRLVVGSSKKTTNGCFSNDTIKLSLRRWPNANPGMNALPILVSKQSIMPDFWHNLSIMACLSIAFAPGSAKRSAARRSACLHVRNVHWISIWVTREQCLSKMLFVNTLPLRRTVPYRVPGPRWSVRQFRNMVFPAPDGPMIANTFPDAISTDTSCKIIFKPFFLFCTVYHMLSALRTDGTLFIQLPPGVAASFGVGSDILHKTEKKTRRGTNA